ncbi:MAG: hypothetical protein CSA75_01245 [Sorangium cellulosum]|nr:MAG: hypothetical protein CSA75_01245 [Sorangium cellulosum]
MPWGRGCQGILSSKPAFDFPIPSRQILINPVDFSIQIRAMTANRWFRRCKIRATLVLMP